MSFTDTRHEKVTASVKRSCGFPVRIDGPTRVKNELVLGKTAIDVTGYVYRISAEGPSVLPYKIFCVGSTDQCELAVPRTSVTCFSPIS
eukprot:2804321-Rhodomonas_salina.2